MSTTEIRGRTRVRLPREHGSVTSCPKCGHGDLQRLYRDRIDFPSASMFFTDVLEVTCRSCGYSVMEEPADRGEEAV